MNKVVITAVTIIFVALTIPNLMAAENGYVSRRKLEESIVEKNVEIRKLIKEVDTLKKKIATLQAEQQQTATLEKNDLKNTRMPVGMEKTSDLKKTVELQRAEIKRLKTLCQRNGIDLSPTPQTSVSQLKYNVVESKMLNDARVISITTTQFDRAKDIAMELVSQNKSYYMVRVFLHKPGQIPGRGLATIRYEWTESQGLVKSFDTRTPAPRKDPNPTLPKYEVLFRVKQYMGNKRIYGDVLIVSFSRAIPAKDREQIARAICKQERLDDISLYSTRDAYEANMSESYSRSHPGALEKGFLGSLTDGKFVAGEVLFP